MVYKEFPRSCCNTNTPQSTLTLYSVSSNSLWSSSNIKTLTEQEHRNTCDYPILVFRNLPDQKMPKVVTNFHKVSSWLLMRLKSDYFQKFWVMPNKKMTCNVKVHCTKFIFSFVNYIICIYNFWIFIWTILIFFKIQEQVS